MKIKQILAVAAMCLATVGANAQDNVVKLGLDALAFGQINLHYERMITPRQGANIMIGYGLPLPLDQNTINTAGSGQATTSNESDIKMNSGSFSTFETVAEYRFYTSEQEGPRGFYVAPQLYYKNFGVSLLGSHKYPDPSFTNTATDKINLNWGIFGVGAQLGAQWLIQDRVSIDWMFLGLGLGFHTIGVTGTTSEPGRVEAWANEAAQYTGSNSTLSGAGFTFTHDKIANSISASTSAPSIYLRMGLAIGYAF